MTTLLKVVDGACGAFPRICTYLPLFWIGSGALLSFLPQSRLRKAFSYEGFNFDWLCSVNDCPSSPSGPSSPPSFASPFLKRSLFYLVVQTPLHVGFPFAFPSSPSLGGWTSHTPFLILESPPTEFFLIFSDALFFSPFTSTPSDVLLSSLLDPPLFFFPL